MTVGCGAASFHQIGDQSDQRRRANSSAVSAAWRRIERRMPRFMSALPWCGDNYTCGGTIGMLQHVMAAGRMVDEKAGTL